MVKPCYHKAIKGKRDRPPAGKENDMKKRIDIYGSIPENMEWNDNQAVVVHENGWFKADMTCTTKSVKVALNRFFKAIPELADWREWMEEEVTFHCNYTGVHFEIDCTNAAEDDPTIYIFLNINEAARGGLD